MYCPKCNQHQKNKTAQKKCPKCGYKFVFMPLSFAKINDKLFLNKIKLLSLDGKLFFTLKQLYYEVLKKTSFRAFSGCFGIILMVISVISFIVLLDRKVHGVIGASLMLLIIVAFSGGILAIIFTPKKWNIPYDIKKFKELIIKPWEKAQGEIYKLIPDNELNFNISKYQDLKDYSFDALLITSNNEIANMLIKNDFHFKNKVAIVSFQKYPQHMFPYVIDQICKNPNIPIFLLHDADIIFANMQRKIEKGWFPNIKIKIFDIGFHPYQVMKIKKFITLTKNNSNLNQIDLSQYSKDEQKWFKEGNYAELDFFRPIELEKVILRAIQTVKETGSLKGFLLTPPIDSSGIGGGDVEDFG